MLCPRCTHDLSCTHIYIDNKLQSTPCVELNSTDFESCVWNIITLNKKDKLSCGSELAFVNFYLILDHVPKYSITQSLHLYNPFKLGAGISRN